MKKRILFVSTVTAVMLCFAGCLPPVYIYERPTIMEEEASGEYPLLKEEMLKKSEAMGPKMISPDKLEKDKLSGSLTDKNKEKIYTVINGEYLLVEREKTEKSGK